MSPFHSLSKEVIFIGNDPFSQLNRAFAAKQAAGKGRITTQAMPFLNDYDALGRMFASSNRLAPGLFKKKELGWLANAKIIAMLELNKHLHGVTLAPTVDLWHPIRTQAPPIRILPQYTCDSLLTAMWLQAYIAATERRIVRGHCKGCGRPFEARDKRQEYCDKYCRHATNQRDHYRRKKQLKRGGTI